MKQKDNNNQMQYFTYYIMVWFDTTRTPIYTPKLYLVVFYIKEHGRIYALAVNLEDRLIPNLASKSMGVIRGAEY